MTHVQPSLALLASLSVHRASHTTAAMVEDVGVDHGGADVAMPQVDSLPWVNEEASAARAEFRKSPFLMACRSTGVGAGLCSLAAAVTLQRVSTPS